MRRPLSTYGGLRGTGWDLTPADIRWILARIRALRRAQPHGRARRRWARDWRRSLARLDLDEREALLEAQWGEP